MAFAIKMGTKIMCWFDDLNKSAMPDAHKAEFRIVVEILYQRLEYLVDGPDLH